MRSLEMRFENTNGVDQELALDLLHHYPGMWFANIPAGLLALLKNPYVYVNTYARVDGYPAVLKRPFELGFTVLKATGQLKFMVASGTTNQRQMSIFMTKAAVGGSFLPASFVSVHPYEPLNVGVADPHVEAQVHIGGAAEAAALLYEAATNPDGYLASLNALDQVQAIGGQPVPEEEKYVFVEGAKAYKITYIDSDAGAIVACNLNRGTIEDETQPLRVTLEEVVVKPYP